MEFKSNIHAVLNKKIKIDKTISQTKLANIMNVSPVAVNKWLNGGSIEISKIPSLCIALNITPNELFGLEQNIDEVKMKQLYTSFIEKEEHQESIKKLLNLK